MTFGSNQTINLSEDITMDDPKVKVEVSKPTLTETKPTLTETKPTNQQENN